MKQLILLVCFPVLFVMIGCKTSKSKSVDTKIPVSDPGIPTTVKVMDTAKLVDMSKGACYGTCPIYTMTIHENGVAKFAGKRFCAMIGPHIAQMSSEQIKSLEQHIAGIQVEKLPEKFESMIADLPSTAITFYREDGTSKNVWWNMNAPEELVDLSTVLDTYRGSLTWIIDNEAPLPEGAVANQFVVYLNDGVTASDFAKQFSKYNFIPKKEVPSQNYWLFEYDTDKISPYEMFDLINKSGKIENARFNTKVTER